MNKVIAFMLVVWAFFIGGVSYYDERLENHGNEVPTEDSALSGRLNQAEAFVLVELSEGKVLMDATESRAICSSTRCKF